jgi:anti-sigma regulatory factor (Ser/Thr protein kinase)
MPAPLEMSLPAAPASAADAREALRRLPLPEEIVEKVALLVTELVANAVVHGRTLSDRRIRFELEVDDHGAVRGAVSDHGPGFTARLPDEPDLTTPGGLGLVLVDRLADRWGVSRDGATKVWFEIDRLQSATTRLPLWACATPPSTPRTARSLGASRS